MLSLGCWRRSRLPSPLCALPSGCRRDLQLAVLRCRVLPIMILGDFGESFIFSWLFVARFNWSNSQVAVNLSSIQMLSWVTQYEVDRPHDAQSRGSAVLLTSCRARVGLEHSSARYWARNRFAARPFVLEAVRSMSCVYVRMQSNRSWLVPAVASFHGLVVVYRLTCLGIA